VTPDKGGQLAGAGEGVNVADFSQQAASGQIANAGDRGEQVALLFQLRMLVKVIV